MTVSGNQQPDGAVSTSAHHHGVWYEPAIGDTHKKVHAKQSQTQQSYLVQQSNAAKMYKQNRTEQTTVNRAATPTHKTSQG